VLDPLTREETTLLVRTLARPATPEDILADLAARIWRLSEGNPFVASEAMRAVTDEAMRPATEDLPVPPNVQQAITRRLDTPTPNAQRLAAVGAVIGRDFDFRLTSCAARLSEAEATEAVELLVRQHILEAHGDHFTFTHARVRDVVYGRLLTPRRKLL